MGNRATLDLRALPLGTALPEDEEPVVRLEANNALPLFWLALLTEADVRGGWEATVRQAMAELGREGIFGPLRVGWDAAQRNLQAARHNAPARAPDLAPMLDAWADALHTLARLRRVDRVELDIIEISNFYDDADGFVDHVLRGVVLWHGEGPPKPPLVQYPALELGGFTGNGVPFPPGMPQWLPGHEPQEPRPAPWWSRVWVSVPAGVLLVCAGWWLGGLPGAIAAVGCYVAFETWAGFRR